MGVGGVPNLIEIQTGTKNSIEQLEIGKYVNFLRLFCYEQSNRPLYRLSTRRRFCFIDLYRGFNE